MIYIVYGLRSNKQTIGGEVNVLGNFLQIFLVHFCLLVPAFSTCSYNESVVYSPVVESQKSLSRDRWGVSHLAPSPSGRWSLPLVYKPWLEGKVGETYQGDWKKEEGALLSLQVRSSFCPTATVTLTHPEHEWTNTTTAIEQVKMCRNMLYALKNKSFAIEEPFLVSQRTFQWTVIKNKQTCFT